MNIFQAIKSRESIREYLDKKVETEKVSNILEMARLAPSFLNRQEWRLIVVQDNETKNRLVNDANCPSFFADAPIVIVGCGVPNNQITSSDKSSYIIDTTIALNYVSLTAVGHGLGTCWVSIFNEEKIKDILKIPEEVKVIALVTIGHPKNPPQKKKKRIPLAQLIKFEKW